MEFATLAWVDWFNTRRLLEPIGYVPPAEYEAQHEAERRRQPTTTPPIDAHDQGSWRAAIRVMLQPTSIDARGSWSLL